MNLSRRTTPIAILGLLTAWTSLLTSITANAAEGVDQDEKSNFGVELSTGLEYSSKVSIDEIDAVATNGDIAALLGAKLDFEHDLTRETRLDFGYSFSKTVHDEFDQFDMQSHFGSAELSHDFGKIDAGISQRYLTSSLDGADFLTYKQTAPYLTAFFGKRVFLRAELGFAEKDFGALSERDSDVQSVGTDWFFFLNGTKTYLLVGYRFDQEDALAPQYDHDRHNLKLHLVQRFEMFGRPGKLNVGVRHQDRQYSDIWPSIGEVRDERRQKLRASLDLPLTDRFGTVIKYELRDVTSNVPEADRSDQLISVELIARF